MNMVHNNDEIQIIVQSETDDNINYQINNNNSNNNLDELLIRLVKERPALYDNRTSPDERSRVSKNNLWNEISVALNGQVQPDAAETRWRYLRENFMKARKKRKLREEAARKTGASVKLNGKIKRHSYRYYELMDFLEEAVDRPKMTTEGNSAQPNESITNGIVLNSTNGVTVLPVLNEVEDSNISINNIEVNGQVIHIEDPLSPHISDVGSSSNMKTDDNNIENYDEIFLECLQRPIEKPSPIDGFLIRLGEGLRRLPYRERSRLELEFLKRLHEVEEQVVSYDENQ